MSHLVSTLVGITLQEVGVHLCQLVTPCGLNNISIHIFIYCTEMHSSRDYSILNEIHYCSEG